MLEGLTAADLAAGDIIGVDAGRSADVIGVGSPLSEAVDRYITTSAEGQTWAGRDGADALITGAGNDAIEGQGGSDLITAGAGDDRIIGNEGSDIMTGRAGVDTFVFTAGEETGFTADYITDFEHGTDVVELNGFGFADVTDLSWTSVGSGIAAQLTATRFVVFEGYADDTDLVANPGHWDFN